MPGREPCRICGMTGGHWAGCAGARTCAPAAAKVNAALHANAQGGIVDVLAFEAAESQAFIESVTLTYDPVTRSVQRGPTRALDIESAVNIEVTHLMERGWTHVRVRDVITRPWWRAFQRTPARQIIPGYRLEDFTVKI